MSEQLSAAAAAMGIPETLVERSAEARAAETGQSADEILAAWAGDAPIPEPAAPEAPPEEPAEEAEPAAEQPEEAEPAAPEVVVEVPEEAPQPAAAPAATAPYRPPILVGARDNPMNVLAAVVGLFAVVLLVGLIGPAIQGEAPGARTSRIDLSEQALEGREIYQSLNCNSCHTQMVRPVIADVGLGAVTVHDTNQVLGVRRFGPDLSNVGARLTEAQIGAVVTGLGEHPVFGLSDSDLAALTAYLAESHTLETSEPAEEAAEPEEGS